MPANAAARRHHSNSISSYGSNIFSDIQQVSISEKKHLKISQKTSLKKRYKHIRKSCDFISGKTISEKDISEKAGKHIPTKDIRNS